MNCSPLAARSNQPRRARHEEGSAYILSLLVLVLLAVIGMSLALTTQTELQIGANERISTRVFYAGDTGVEVAAARSLAAADPGPLTFTLTDDGLDLTGSGYEFFTDVQTTAFVPLDSAYCNLCQFQQGDEYLRLIHAVTAVAQRFGTYDQTVTRKLLAQKTIATMFDIQPRVGNLQDFLPIADPTTRGNVKF
jgi:hypothetical protein